MGILLTGGIEVTVLNRGTMLVNADVHRSSYKLLVIKVAKHRSIAVVCLCICL